MPSRVVTSLVAASTLLVATSSVCAQQTDPATQAPITRAPITVAIEQLGSASPEIRARARKVILDLGKPGLSAPPVSATTEPSPTSAAGGSMEAGATGGPLLALDHQSQPAPRIATSSRAKTGIRDGGIGIGRDVPPEHTAIRWRLRGRCGVWYP
jgi:hypothetical protein